MIRLTLGITLTVGAIVAFVAAISRSRKHIQFAYHEMHSLTMLAYGISVLLLCNTFEGLVSLTTFLFVFYSFSEIIFCNWLFNLKQKVVFKIILVRLLLAVLIGIGTVVAIQFSTITPEVLGILFIMIGANIVLYVPVMKNQRNDVAIE